MTFNWADYLKLARALRQLAEAGEAFAPIHEASHRAAISCAYYAAFGSCYQFILNNRSSEIILSKSPTAHAELINYLSSSSNKTESKIGKMLAEMRHNRNSADYENEIDELIDAISKDTVDSAHKILEIIKII